MKHETEARATAVRTAEEHAAPRSATCRVSSVPRNGRQITKRFTRPSSGRGRDLNQRTQDSRLHPRQRIVCRQRPRAHQRLLQRTLHTRRKTHYSLLLSGEGSSTRDEFAHVYQSIDLGDDVVKALAGASRCMRLRVGVRRPGSDAADAPRAARLAVPDARRQILHCLGDGSVRPAHASDR